MRSLTVVRAELPLASVALVLSIPVGSRDEPAPIAGLAHLLEHLLPTGKSRRSNYSFEDWVETVGGHSNASTGVESVNIWARVPTAYAPEAARRLLHSLWSPPMDEAALARERAIVLEELANAATDHYERALDSLVAKLFGRHPLGRPVGGRPKTLAAISCSDLETFWRGMVWDTGAVLALAGDAEGVEAATAAATAECPDVPVELPTPPRRVPPAMAVHGRELEPLPTRPRHGYAMIGGAGASRRDPHRAAYTVLAELMGASPRSLLFRRLRHELQLSYDVSSWHSSLSDSGFWSVAVSSAAANAPTIRDAIVSILESVESGAVDRGEISATKRRLVGQIGLASDDPLVRAEYLATGVLDRVKGDPIEASQKAIARVTPRQVSEAATRILDTLVSVFR